MRLKNVELLVARTIMANQLFRQEAVDARRNRIEGTISLSHQAPIEYTTLVLIGLVAAAGLAVSLGRYDHTETVTGQVVSSLGVAKVVPVKPGTLTEVRTREGQAVTRGQVLAMIRLEQGTSAGTFIGDARGRLLDQQEHAEEDDLAGDRLRRDADIASYRAQIGALLKQEQQLRRSETADDALVATSQEAFDRLRGADTQGLVARTVVEQRRQAMLQYQQQRATLSQQEAELKDRVLLVQQQIRAAEADYRSKRDTSLSSLSDIAQHKLEETDILYSVVAPVSGTVTGLQAEVGQFVDGRVPLLSIVPSGGKRQVVLYVPTKAAGFVEPGQRVKLRYDAFPYEKFGTFGGHVTAVAHSILAPNEVDADVKLQDPVFRVIVGLDSESAPLSSGRPIEVQPGMTLMGDIILERRTFLDWLLEPLRAVTRR